MTARYRAAVFHGTSIRQWKRRRPAPSTLYLTASTADAIEYAYRAAGHDEEDGYVPRPVVYVVAIDDLRGLTFGPDWGWDDATAEMSWDTSLAAVGSFTVEGDIDRYKSRFYVFKSPADLAGG